ncbi:MAG: hypothetical protein AAFP89_17265 [Bacteroidota bacterium]
MKKVLSYILAVIMLLSAVVHLAMPAAYEPLIPPFISPDLANILTAVLEAVVGVLLLLPKYRTWGGLGFGLLMVGFLPIHVWDMLRETPFIGPMPAAIGRVVIQFALIYAGYWIWKGNR